MENDRGEKKARSKEESEEHGQHSYKCGQFRQMLASTLAPVVDNSRRQWSTTK